MKVNRPSIPWWTKCCEYKSEKERNKCARKKRNKERKERMGRRGRTNNEMKKENERIDQ